MDVLGWLTEDDVTTHMAEVQALPLLTADTDKSTF
jgi:hypothetical protein